MLDILIGKLPALAHIKKNALPPSMPNSEISHRHTVALRNNFCKQTLPFVNGKVASSKKWLETPPCKYFQLQNYTDVYLRVFENSVSRQPGNDAYLLPNEGIAAEVSAQMHDLHHCPNKLAVLQRRRCQNFVLPNAAANRFRSRNFQHKNQIMWRTGKQYSIVSTPYDETN